MWAEGELLSQQVVWRCCNWSWLGNWELRWSSPFFAPGSGHTPWSAHKMWPQEGIYIPPHTHIFCYKSGTPFSLSGERECLAPYQPLHHSLTFRLHATCLFTFILSNLSKWSSATPRDFPPSGNWRVAGGIIGHEARNQDRLLPSRHEAPPITAWGFSASSTQSTMVPSTGCVCDPLPSRAWCPQECGGPCFIVLPRILESSTGLHIEWNDLDVEWLCGKKMRQCGSDCLWMFRTLISHQGTPPLHSVFRCYK